MVLFVLDLGEELSVLDTNGLEIGGDLVDVERSRAHFELLMAFLKIQDRVRVVSDLADQL